jgi:TatA/E family protein of Tat protein translocase
MIGIGWQQVAVVLLVGVLLFGPRRITSLARALGQSVTELRRGHRGEEEDEQ